MAQDMNRHFTLSALLKFTFPTICMMIFTSLYTVVDGFFVSNYIGKTALAAVNLAWPIIMILATVGLMTGTGGSALIAKTRGEGDDEQANRYFSMLVFFTIAVSLVLGALGQAAIVPAMQAFGADGPLLDSAVSYGRWLLGMLPFFALQFAFEVLFSTAGKPHYGFFVVVAGGVTNVVLDWLFICVLGWGIDGTAIATGLGQVMGGAIPLVYFARRHNSSFLRLRWTRPEWRPIGKACLNGCSELVSNIAMSLVTMLYNFQLMAYIGEDGVAAYSVIGYTAMIFGAVFMGYAVGSSPLMSYQFGAGNHGEMRSILLKSLGLIGASSLAMFLAAQWLAAPLSAIFVSYDPELLDFTVHAYKLYALAFLIMGLPIYLSALFTALNNGVVSAVIAFMRTLVFECGAVILLPLVWGINGIWLSVSVGELAAALLAVGFLVALRKRYGFAKK
ncbi:MATE family efflux transporter [Parvibacter caecicola]|uniref:Multidrug export protein MepA n=1 Tax=Parvibacter caecicola TaxID=747645 RepID=A0A4T9T6J8_9ACTN|nr:MATE family efflux transporter [Parvibacter caecicola]TJW09964.1 MATE family efflux transporter [Parvibacter caecicola]